VSDSVVRLEMPQFARRVAERRLAQIDRWIRHSLGIRAVAAVEISR
jgi:hypothetical protein